MTGTVTKFTTELVALMVQSRPSLLHRPRHVTQDQEQRELTEWLDEFIRECERDGLVEIIS